MPNIATLRCSALLARARERERDDTSSTRRGSTAETGDAVDYANSHGSAWDFARDQVRTFGRPLGPLPKSRAATNGIILHHGYIGAAFGDIHANDPVYSVAKSFLSTAAAVAVDRGLIRDVNDPVAKYIHDGGYPVPRESCRASDA